jgi:hypothetical protein
MPNVGLRRGKQNVVAVRHTSGDELAAVVEVVSKGNKSDWNAFDQVPRRWRTVLEPG